MSWTAVIYVLVNSLVLAFERAQSATLLLGLVHRKRVHLAPFFHILVPEDEVEILLFDE